jgi:hypothetical protein
MGRHRWIALRPVPGDLVATMTETPRPALVINPAGDVAFRDHAEAALQEGRSARELQQILRRDYPRTVVRARDLAGERQVVWYVYRDGHWIAGDDGEQG